MGKSLIQTVNGSTQTVAAGNVIALGTTIRRYGCNCRLNGDAIEVRGEGYYKIDATVTATPTAAGNVQIAMYANGVQVPGAIATTYMSAGNPVTLPITATIRQGCACDTADNLTLVLIEGAGTVDSMSLRIEKA